MTVFDTDIVTLLSYGQTAKLKERIEAAPEGEVLAVTVITLMQILGPRYDSIYKAAIAGIYDRIHNGTIEVSRDAATKLYLFPDEPRTITLFKQLRAGKLQKLRF